MDKTTSLGDAIACIKNGMRIGLGGMTLYRRPVLAAIAMGAAGLKDLELVTLTGGIETDLLIGAGCVSTLRSCYTGLEVAGFAPHFTRCIQNGSLALVEETEYTLSYAVQAAAMRVPFLPMLGVIDQTDIANVRKDLKKFICPLTGVDLYAVPALSLDVAIIHVSAADNLGNCNFQGQLGIDTYLPMVAEKTIVTTERIVTTDELIAMPGSVQIPGLTVTHVVKAPGGSFPTSCLPSVSLDMDALLDYADAARDEKLWVGWWSDAKRRVVS
jgi:glutaconate CoA-transferase subunit A